MQPEALRMPERTIAQDIAMKGAAKAKGKGKSEISRRARASMSRRRGSISPSHTRGMARRRARVSLPRSGFTMAIVSGPDLTGNGTHRSFWPLECVSSMLTGTLAGMLSFSCWCVKYWDFKFVTLTGTLAVIISFG